MEITAEQIKRIAELKLPPRETHVVLLLYMLSSDKTSAIYDTTDLRQMTGQTATALSKVLTELVKKRILIRNSRNKVTFNF